MKRLSILVVLTLIVIGVRAQKTDVVNNGYPIGQVPFTAVKIMPNTFWGQRIKAAREVTIPLAFSKCESEHRYKNFEMAAYTLQHPGHPGLETAEWDVAKFMGFSFDDTDVYKTIEGASYVLQTYPDKCLKNYIDSVLDIVAAAQESDGYLYTARTINPNHPHGWAGKHRWERVEVLSHELYNLGHMVDAACAHYQATGSDKFLNIAKRYADCVIREVGPNPGQACVVPGHQIAEMALARLYVLTGEKKYLDQAKFFLDMRGKTTIHDIYSQSDKPILEQKEAWGHAVRAGYMYSGIADVAALTGDKDYVRTIDAIWQNIVGRKYYITGGVGARHSGESFGADYELPNLTAYNETCAAIAMVYLFYRMFLLHGEAKYIDCLERTLYNGVISGMSIDGGRFFYPNPLSADGKYMFNADNTNTRQPWFGCACCPSNLCRFIPSLPGYMYAVHHGGKDAYCPSIYVNLFAGSTATMQVNGKKVELEQQTNYPWNGDVAIRVKANQAGLFTMKVRIPGWVHGEVVPTDLYTYADNEKLGYTVNINGQQITKDGSAPAIDKDGYVSLTRKWKKGDVVNVHFDMKVRTVKAHRRVAADHGKLSVERGPLVYCAEAADNTGMDIFNFLLTGNPGFQVIDNPTLVGGVQQITANGQVLDYDSNGKVKVSDAVIKLIPYYAWNHRGAGKMQVWLTNQIINNN